MRKVFYKVKANNGTEFQTTDYSVADANGNKIVETFLETVDERTPEEKAKAREHARKVREKILQRKRG